MRVFVAAVLLAVAAAAAEPEAYVELVMVQRVPLAAAGSLGKRDVVEMTGCPSRVFTVPVTIGVGRARQTFDLRVDTGSSTLGVASDQCACEGVTPRFASAMHKAEGAVDSGQGVLAQYADGSGWQGTIWRDVVTVGSATLRSFRFAAISTAAGFFGASNCQERGPAANQGILGMAYDAIALRSAGAADATDSFADAWEQAALGTPAGRGSSRAGSLVFAMTLCTSAGVLMIGGYNASYAVSAPLYVPLVENTYYRVTLTGMSFTDASGADVRFTVVPAGAAGASVFGGAILDSGATNVVVPPEVLARMSTFLDSVASFVSVFGGGFLGGDYCRTSALSVEQMNRMWPWLRVDLSDGVAVVLPPVSSYVIREDRGPSGVFFCPGARAGAVTNLGYAFMNNFLTIFDRTDARFTKGAIGLASTAQCGTGALARVLYNDAVFGGNQSFPANSAPDTRRGTWPAVGLVTAAALALACGL
eukprot:Unigene7156_Nuclearia_a/m.21952 Unigene7156_Nuclearia_a/g.21952  ORF Unigene7156_Nuclearia_a/g.21952 Unigene7156_Nuclearia_a/m.21952 type:complete len:476 (-) Unigene7156_Nuclearia_a:122-1549(-)